MLRYRFNSPVESEHLILPYTGWCMFKVEFLGIFQKNVENGAMIHSSFDVNILKDK